MLSSSHSTRLPPPDPPPNVLVYSRRLVLSACWSACAALVDSLDKLHAGRAAVLPQPGQLLFARNTFLYEHLPLRDQVC